MATDTETVSDYSIQARSKSKFHYTGVSHVPETEQQDKSSESDDDIPVATLLRKENTFTMTEQQKKDCLEGPQGERAIGVVVAKTFDGVEFRGTVDSFRTARQRHYYHVVYTDGDEEEMSQTELRDGYLLGLSDEILRHWNMYVGNKKGKRNEDKGNTCQNMGRLHCSKNLHQSPTRHHGRRLQSLADHSWTRLRREIFIHEDC